MSTNPFRQIRTQTQVQSPAGRPIEALLPSDGSGSDTVNRNDLTLNVNVHEGNNNYQRHVSFASPPVNSTFPAASYPSSPESTRSPPGYFNHAPGLPTPDYRTAIQSDPFGDLARDRQEDSSLQQAVSNAQNNINVDQQPGQLEQSQDSAVLNTLSRFAATPLRSPAPNVLDPNSSIQDSRKSLDVDAFKRLLLTGRTETAEEFGANNQRPAPPPPLSNAWDDTTATFVPETTFGSTGLGSSDVSDLNAKRASFIDSLLPPKDGSISLEAGKLPPPAPAPRRAKSVKSRDLSPLPTPSPNELTSVDGGPEPTQEKILRKPPAPPLARRQSQRIPSNRSDDSIATPSPTSSPAEPVRAVSKPLAPPPPPVRRQPSTTSRRPSHDLAPTIEEPEAEHQGAPALGSRKSSTDRPSLPGSRDPSMPLKPLNAGLMNPPPLPPPRRGRGSSRSSIDGFRPSLATLMGNEDSQEDAPSAEQLRKASIKDQSSLTPSNADSILVELASLQKEVDAARRS